LPLVPGDRFVLREAGRSETVGGGEILDVDPVLPASRARPSRSVDRVIAERGWVDAADLTRLTGQTRQPTVGRWVADPAAVGAVTETLVRAVRDAGEAGIDVAALDDRQRAVLAGGIDGISVSSGRAYEARTAPGDEAALPAPAAGALERLEARPWSPPDLPPADRAALRELARRGLAVEAGPVWFSTSAVERAAEVVAALLRDSPDGVSVAAVRDALGTTRKHVIPLLGHLDSTGVTRRRGDLRIGGPRLPR
jgi:selenocysteine-specific elongation factor